MSSQCWPKPLGFLGAMLAPHELPVPVSTDVEEQEEKTKNTSKKRKWETIPLPSASVVAERWTKKVDLESDGFTSPADEDEHFNSSGNESTHEDGEPKEACVRPRKRVMLQAAPQASLAKEFN